MTRRDTLQCVHEPFGDAFYFGPERLSERYEKDEEGRIESGFSESTFKTIFDRIERENAEVGLSCPSALNCFSRLLSCCLLCFFWSLRTVMPNTTTIPFLILVLMLAFVTCDSLTSTITPLHDSRKDPAIQLATNGHIKASYASISSGNFAPDAAFLPFLVSFLLPNHSHHLRVPT